MKDPWLLYPEFSIWLKPAEECLRSSRTFLSSDLYSPPLTLGDWRDELRDLLMLWSADFLIM